MTETKPHAPGAGSYVVIYDFHNASNDDSETYWGDFATAEEAEERFTADMAGDKRIHNARLCKTLKVLKPTTY